MVDKIGKAVAHGIFMQKVIRLPAVQLIQIRV